MKRHALVLIVLVALLAPANLHAIPAWSRQLGVSCAMCHATPTNQLTKDGLDFLKNGHRSEALKFNEKDQKLENYFSLLFKARLTNDQWDGARTGNLYANRARTQYELHSMAIYSGGALSDRLSYFAEIYLSENTGSTSGSNVVQGDASRKKLAEAFLQYNAPIGDGKQAYLKVRAGQIVPEMLHVFGIGARSAEQRAIVLNEALSGNSNTYRPFNRQQGLEASIVHNRFNVALATLNGSDASTTNSLDADRDKDFSATALVKLDEHESAIGVIRYNGNFTNYKTKQDPSTDIVFKNPFNRTGVVGRFLRDNWRVVGTYFAGEETMNAAGNKTNNAGYYTLADYNFNEKYGVYTRYDRLDPNTDLKSNEVSMIMFGVNGYFFQSEKSGARWNLEYTLKNTYLNGGISTAGTTKYTDGRLFGQLTWAF